MVKPGMYISDRYEIIEKIGSGGMADVYKAKCHRLNRYVAIKILKQEYSTDKNFITKFRGEAQSVAGLSHPNIVSVYDVGEDNGLHYIVMELVEGITLKKFIEKKGHLTVKESVGIAIQIAQGLEDAHNNHIIHRDIKPQNIMISREGKVKVADFGIAKAVSANTYTQNAIGSVHYLSPEQARGGYCDEKSDIYSLGVTLYEMLSGSLPFAGDNTVSVALLHIQSEPRPVRELVPEVQYSLDRIVQKCLQKRPENRYLSASELILDLKRSITNPEGDFVRLPVSGYVPDNPTRMFTDNEVEEIRTTAAKSPVVHYDSHQKGKSQVLKEEEEELDSINTNWEKFVIIGSIIVAIILTIGIIYLAARFFGIADLFNTNPTPSPTPTVAVTDTPIPTPTNVPAGTIGMPNLKGYTFEDAEKLLKLKSEDFIIILEDEVYSSETKGTVIDQYPLAYSDVLLDATIRLTISAGPELIQIPSYFYETEEEARQNLIALGLVVSVTYESNEELPVGRVVRTEPAGGETLYKGDSIRLVVSTGSNPTYQTMINLIGKTLDEARTALEREGLVLGETTTAYSANFKKGMVMRQNVEEGDSVLSGTAINVVVSDGPEPTKTPEPDNPDATVTPEPENPVDNPEATVTPEPENPVDNPDATVTPEPDENPADNPEAEATPAPTAVPEPTSAPATADYFPLTLSTAGEEVPFAEGETVFYYIEIDMVESGVSYLIAEGTMSYNDYPREAFSFQLKKDNYPNLEEGLAKVYLFVGDEGLMAKQWTVELQEFTQ